VAEKQQIETRQDQDQALAAVIAGAVAKAVAETQAALDEKKGPPENKTGSLKSCYNPEGLKVRPKLAGKFYFCGAELDPNYLTNDEIRKLNTITFSGDFHKNQWHVRVRRDDDNTMLVRIDLPVKTLDQRMEIPNSLMAILDEIKADYADQQAKAKAAVE
jgi:hypothetical protein